MVQRANEIDWKAFKGMLTLGLSAGASAPDILVDEVIKSARMYFDVTIEEVSITQEDVCFKIPKVLEIT